MAKPLRLKKTLNFLTNTNLFSTKNVNFAIPEEPEFL